MISNGDTCELAKSEATTAFLMSVRKGYRPWKKVARLGVHVGMDQALRKRTPARAMVSMLGVLGLVTPPYPKTDNWSTPKSSSTTKRILGGCGSLADAMSWLVPLLHAASARADNVAASQVRTARFKVFSGVLLHALKVEQSNG